IGAGLKRRIVGIFKRLADEGKQQAALIRKLEQGLNDSAKKKAAAKKKKEEEAKKKKEEEAKKKKEEEAKKKKKK
ncbi:MAG: hypothetical protein V3R14_04040, partial [Nitrospinaceae bacterium]